jgi:hypothetical protein
VPGVIEAIEDAQLQRKRPGGWRRLLSPLGNGAGCLSIATIYRSAEWKHSSESGEIFGRVVQKYASQPLFWETTMFFLQLMNEVLGRRSTPKMSEPRPTTRLHLEELEDRLTPAPVFAGTYTDAIVQVTPNLAAGTVTEKVTATVITAPQYSPITGQTTPVPGGAGTPTGMILINLNNQQQQVKLDANGQATATFTLPLLSVLTSQELMVNYSGSFNASSNSYQGSQFNAPLFMNHDNVFLPSTLTFGQLTPQQVSPSFDSSGHVTSLASLNTGQGETDNLGLFAFHYGDPGTIDSVDIAGFHLPGLVAIALDAYGTSTANAKAP